MRSISESTKDLLLPHPPYHPYTTLYLSRNFQRTCKTI